MASPTHQTNFIDQLQDPSSVHSDPPPAYDSGHQDQVLISTPIQKQPGGDTGASSGIHYGTKGADSLESRLRNASSFFIKQEIDALELVSPRVTPNRYTVMDQDGNMLFKVREEFNSRQPSCPRLFTLRVKDLNGKDVLKLEREKVCCFCVLGNADRLNVSSQFDGQILGSVETHHFYIFNPGYSLRDARGNTMLGISGPFCCRDLCCNLGMDVTLDVTTPDGVKVGRLCKTWSGAEEFAGTINISISFPKDLSASMKTVCLAAPFLMDYHHWESGSPKNLGRNSGFSDDN